MIAWMKELLHPNSIQNKLRWLIITFAISAVLILMTVLGLLMAYNNHYSGLLYNVTTVSEFNQQFKENIDLKMYYYVIESQYSEGLPISEIKDAQILAQNLLNTTTGKEGRLAISSVLDLCKNLEEKIYQISLTKSYDERQEQLENNVYILTSLIQEFMYTYLYHEAAQLNALQSKISTQIITEMVIIPLFMVGLLLVMTRYISRLSSSITVPIVDLCTRVEEISAGNLSVQTPVESGEYEIRILSEGMEQMVERLNDQIKENFQKQSTLRRTELALLQAQINPHFLYNTMDTIIWLIEAEKAREAMDMLSNLSTFFRHSLSQGEDVITLQEEERHVCSYLLIQQVRYKDIMQYTLNIDPSLHDVLIPKLTLQPLVENALYHGIKMKRGMGHIYVTGRLDGDDVVLQVTDDGVGMPPERLAQLNQTISGAKRVGFGFSTVHERIRLLFGSQYGLSISSKNGVGTTITIRIPKNKNREGNAT